MGKAPQAILNLVERFERNIASYRAGGYNEAQVRTEFIDPMFEALGWDMANRAGRAEAYKDVIHEDAIKVGGATKAPDYCFRIGGTRKFFLEAKRPSVDIRYDADAAYQLRRYGWSSKLALSILTNFEFLAFYDCRIRPNRPDKAFQACIRKLRYDEYVEKWDEIACIFAKEAVLRGAFDQYAEAKRGKRGTSEVDAEFLNEIEGWRHSLARNFSLRNESITVPQLNAAVQTTIDRIIFLRMCEDRGIEPYGQLQALASGDRTYRRLIEVFYRADARYNSGLFHFNAEQGRKSQPDDLTPALNLDDEVLKEIIGSLYYPRSPYEFGVLPPEILGNVYEQFLGKVIRLTDGHNAKVEEKPEVRKAGGVYYTPQYIVDYIVQNTVGELCKGKTPKAVEKLRILDPACGSGSFLLGAYKFLLEYHRDWYTSDGPQKHRNEIYQGRGGQWFLTAPEKKRILLNNIYGVDIDPQAVEVTKLSLLLKVLEDESSETLAHSLRTRHGRALPDIDGNIKCGNSLIGPDFYEGTDPKYISEDQRRRINAFDWHAEFRQIMADGGFDAVIGNPPYGRDILSEFKSFFEAKYTSLQYKVDSYVLFVEQGFTMLKPRGTLGFIIPNTWLNTARFLNLRRFLLEKTRVRRIVNLGKGVFPAANIDTLLLFLDRSHRGKVEVVDASDETLRSLRLSRPRQWFAEDQSDWMQNADLTFNVHVKPLLKRLFSRMEKRSCPLGDLVEVSQGLIPYNNGEDSRRNPYLAQRRVGPEWKKILDKGACVSRYALHWNGTYVKYGPWLYTANQPKFYETDKLLIQRHRNPSLRRRIVATFDSQKFYFKDNLCGMISSGKTYELRYLLGVLNSSLMNAYYKRNYTEVSLNPIYLRKLPIAKINFSDASQARSYRQLIALVQQMLELQKRLSKAKAADEKMSLEREMQQTDDQIDRLVYELYGLTEKEIEIVEEAGA